MEVRSTPVRESDGSTIWYGVMLDVTKRKRAEEQLRMWEQEFRALVENSPDTIVRYDRDCRRIYINPTMERRSGVPAAQMLGTTPTQNPQWLVDPVSYEQAVREVLLTGEERELDVTTCDGDGTVHHDHVHFVPERGQDGQVVSVFAMGRDVTERRRIEVQMWRQANYDALTGLPNRSLFRSYLQEEIKKVARSGQSLALLFIDLDRFKEINDTLGHDFGDSLLVEAAHRLRQCVRDSDTVARLGGDEFLIVLANIAETTHLGRIAQSIIEVFAAPFQLGGHAVYVSASIGIACCPQDADSMEALLSCADRAMYAAKAQGRNGFSFFTASMQEQAKRRLRLANDLRSALAQGELKVYFQPIVEVATGRVVKAESLLRWHHSSLGFIPPNLFIPIAEETGLIHEIGDWVFREAVRIARNWLALADTTEADPVPCQISVNVSPVQISRGSIDTTWIEHLHQLGLAPGCVAVEITEGLLLDHRHDVLGQLNNFSDAGIEVALDDFGTGYSAMSYLKKFNIDYLKIDHSFVRDLVSDPDDRAIAEAVVVMAHKLGLKVVAEGVETAAQREVLAEMGCDYVQGYFYAQPLPAERFLDYLLAMRTGAPA